MAKDSTKHALLGILLIPLIYAFVLRFDATSLRSWAIQLREPQKEADVGQEQLRNQDDKFRVPSKENSIDAEITRLNLQQLLTGKSQEDLLQNEIACIATTYSDMCVTTSAVAIHITTSNTTNLYLTGNQKLPSGTSNITIRPYPRKIDLPAMIRTSPVNLHQANATAAMPPCDVNHAVPAVIFSTGGFAGNFFHDINDLLIPLFLTSSLLRPNVRLILTDYESWWAKKYQRVLSAVSFYDIITSPTNDVAGKIHCFPGAVVGLTYHGHLSCNKTKAPGNLTTVDFLHFLHSSLFLKAHEPPKSVATQKEKPLMVLISRRNSRTLLNEEEIINLAKEVGFRVEIATPKAMSDLQSIAELIHSCRVLLGVHGAGLTNMVFLSPGSVLVQVVPWGLDWVSKAYYHQPTYGMGLKYVEYKINIEESTLIEKYPIDHQVIVDPLSIHKKGYQVSKPIYIDGQNVRLNLTRFRKTLETAMQLAEF
ncbi:Glycosyltransferase family 61 protein [Rhynchospora pubera]|uniref:Glycosyltransferase family 61 protein n=1 Tax=Rhynchospora pubera TaxID=906938 RepID=A0AAV8FLI9_9POAL|nr:Glycosyltransferase family 61 protein [Rhynchospora pubera]